MAEPRNRGLDGQTKAPNSRTRPTKSRMTSASADESRPSFSSPSAGRSDRLAESQTESRNNGSTGGPTEGPTEGNSSSASTDRNDSVAVVSMIAIDRDLMIAEAAYYLAMQRDFEPGHELDDWLAAESKVDAQLLANPGQRRSTNRER